MPARLCIHCLLPLVRRQGNPSSWKRNNPMGSPIPAPFPSSSEWLWPQRKRRREKGSQAPEPLLHLATWLEGDGAEERYRAGRTTQRRSPAQNQEPKTPSTPMKPKFLPGKTRMAKGVTSRSGSDSRTQPERDRGNSSRDQEPGGPGSPAPKALESGGPTGRRRHDLDRETPRKPPQVEAPIPTRRKTSPHCESKDPKAETWGAETEKRNVSLSQCFPKSEGRHHRWNGKWPQKGGKARQWSQRLRLGTDRNPCIVITSKKIAKLDSCQLDTTVARRNRPVKSRRGLRLAPRGRGKRRPAQARRNHHAKLSLEEARIDRKEIPVDDKASRVQELPQPATPEGGVNRRPPIPACDPSAAAEDRSRQPEGQRGSGHPQKRAGTRWGASN